MGQISQGDSKEGETGQEQPADEKREGKAPGSGKTRGRPKSRTPEQLSKVIDEATGADQSCRMGQQSLIDTGITSQR